jgi:hypothetical protein
MEISEQTRESHACRWLRSEGYRLRKTPSRNWTRYYAPGYMIIDSRNIVVAGACQREYEMTIAEVEAFMAAMAAL